MRGLLSTLALVAALGLTSTGAGATPPPARPLLTYAVFPAPFGQTPHGGLCATDLRGHNYRISDPHANGGPSWSPDGRSIAFTRSDNNPGQDHIRDVFVTDAEGRHPRNLTRDAGRGEGDVVAWSPDGSQLILHWSGWMGLGGSYIEDVDGAGSHRIGVEGEQLTSGGSWSPQGRILFSLWSASRQVPAIYITDAAGTYQRKLVDSATGAVWSPDGRQFAYVALRDGRSVGLGVAEADGSSAHLLKGGVGGPAWSPDGREIAYFNAGGVPQTLEVVQADGTEAHTLAEVGEWDSLSGAAWSPDGSMIAFTRGSRLVLIRPDGTGEHTVPTDGLAASNPAWRRPAPLPDRRPCVVRGTARADVIRGTSRGELIYGRAGNDRIYEMAGDDTLVGGGGNDRFMEIAGTMRSSAVAVTTDCTGGGATMISGRRTGSVTSSSAGLEMTTALGGTTPLM